MKWVRMEAWYGKGHQSHGVSYIPVSDDTEEDDLEWYLEEWCDTIGTSTFKGEAEFVDKPPPEVIEELIGKYSQAMAANHKVLMDLKRRQRNDLEL